MQSWAGFKDKGLSLALKTALKERLAPYGRVLDASVDTTAKRIELRVALDGETDPMTVELLDYEIIGDGDQTLLRAGEIRCSRAWMTTLMNELTDTLLTERCWPVRSPALAKLARALL